jgi:hypothetical protein
MSKEKDRLKIDYDRCLEQINNVENCVCEGCGGKLEPIKTVDNAGTPTYWVGCKHCSCFRSGIEKEYYKIARELVEDNVLKPYHSMSRADYSDTPEKLEYYYDSQTAGLSHIIRVIHQMLKEKFNDKEAKNEL